METGMPGSANALLRINSVVPQAEKRMDIQAPLTAVYIHAVPALPAQPSAAAREPATLHLPSLYSKETLPFLTLHIAGGLQSQPGLSLAARPKSAGKHVCPHCGRDCMKPSVLEKHLRCHTGERPYPCTTCGVSFKTQSNLYKHKRTQAHARHSSESEQSSLGSLDSMSGSREMINSSLSLDECSLQESGSTEKEATLPAAENACPTSTARDCSVKMQGSVCELGHNTEPNESEKATIQREKQTMENEKPLLTASRHLQRQEATLFSKQWESSVSRGKSQSHESTDSGFSESSDHYPNPGSVLPDSMDYHAKSTQEHLEENTSTHTSSEPGRGGQGPKDTAREQEQKTLEERISKLISENTAVVEDKQLENIRPRKTVLSKQGSIDLPMPYTYKDSFHFDMRISKTPNVGLQRKAGFYSSVPTQHSTAMEHAPLIRSNSLPFSVTLLQPERSSPTSSHLSDGDVTLARRGSSGQINPTGFTIKPVNQQSATHRPLVRQTAVDCNHATDGLFANSSVEEAYAGGLSCDGDSGDICGEPNNRKLRRKKAQKFAYNKWYMYGGGTFKKLYNVEKGGDDGVTKGRKCSTNPKHEVVQGSQKRSSAIPKEIATTKGETMKDFKSSSATGCRPGCPPAKPSPVSAVDLNLKTSQPHTSCSPLETQHQRNLPLSVLPLPLIGSLVSHKKDNTSRTEAGRLNREEEHSTDSSPQLRGSHLPSDRKKQKTDDKLMCPLKMETDPNTLTRPPPSVAGSALQQDTNLDFQKNEKHSLKGAPFPPCKISANISSVSTPPSSFTPSFAKTSFLPKYQLRLPNAAEPDSNSSTRDVNKPTVTDGRSHLPSERTSPSATTCEKKCSDPITSPLTRGCDIKQTNACSSKQSQPLLPCIATALCQTEISRFDKNATSSIALVHRQFASTAVTTTCLRAHQAGSCSAQIRLSKSAGGSVQLPRPVTPVLVTFPATPATTPANNQTSAAAFSQGQPNPNPPPSSPLSQTPDQSSPANRAHADTNAPIVSCHIVPFDRMQPATQNVFHVHTADLQICLQIISDEQLALIEPQIERQAGGTLSHRCDIKAVAPEGVQNKAQSSVTTESNKVRDHRGHHKELDESECPPTPDTDRIKPPLSLQFGKAMPNLHLAECSNPIQAAVSAEPKLPEAQGTSLHPHKYGHVNTATETQSSAGDVMSTSASLEGGKSVRSQTSEGESALPLNYCAAEQHVPDKRVSQGGSMPQTLPGQRKPRVTFLSPITVSQNSIRSEIPSTESQHKLQIQRALCNVSTINAKSEASAFTSDRFKSGETRPPLPIRPAQASGAVCVDELSGSAVSFPINERRTPRQLNPQASICCSDPVESTSSEVLKPFRNAYTGCDRLGPLDDSAPSQEMSECESQDVISSAHSEKQLGLFTSTSSNVQVDRTIPAVLSSIPSPAGSTEGASLAGCAAQKDLQAQERGGTPTEGQYTGETNHQCTKGQGGGGVAGENKSRGVETDEKPAQRGEAESNGRYMRLMPEGEDRKVEADSFRNSPLHEQDHSQTHSGMSAFPPSSLQQAASTSGDPDLPAGGSRTSLFSSPHPPLKMSDFYLSQQRWESSSITHNQQAQLLCESDSSRCVQAHAQSTETQNAFSRIDSRPQQTQQTLPHQDRKQGRKPTSITHRHQQGNTAAGNNISAVGCCTKSTSGSHISISPDVETPSSTRPSHASYSVQVSSAAAGLTVDSQLSQKNNALDVNTVLPPNPFAYTELDDYQGTKGTAPNDSTSQSCNFRPDICKNYQSFLFAGPLHGYQTASECLTVGERPAQSCQDYAEETSSSDDEGKLIIEL